MCALCKIQQANPISAYDPILLKSVSTTTAQDNDGYRLSFALEQGGSIPSVDTARNSDFICPGTAATSPSLRSSLWGSHQNSRSRRCQRRSGAELHRRL